ncbi:MAG: hypothetical protein EOO68_06520 [Moraxellaceae bacterium]|nr:MAG: hypothetical protein EOO68_06520 [Moraxellaceae bacterium]
MSNLKGWNLTARLISKHFGVLGDKISEAIANFDPETATEADRDNLADTLRQTAQKLAAARSSFEKERQDVTKLRTLIENDEKAFDVLAARLQSGAITESTVNLFCDELESNKARLPVEEQEQADAFEYMNELQKIVDALSQQLADFDAQAKKALKSLAAANAQRDLQELRAERQQQLSELGSLQTKSSALDALTRRAQKIANDAEGLKIVTDINQRPLDQQAELDAIRKSVAQPETAGETALDRLKRLSAKAEAQVA